MPSDPHRGIAFRPVGAGDYGLLDTWLRHEHVRAWWGEPEEELELIRASVEGADRTRCYIVEVEGDALGYVQCWRPADYLEPGWLDEEPWLADVPTDTLGIDIFIGEPERIGGGLGTRIVRAFAARLFSEGVPRLIIDPDMDNRRAVQAYEKAGFRAYGRHVGADGGTTLLMELLAPASRQAGKTR